MATAKKAAAKKAPVKKPTAKVVPVVRTPKAPKQQVVVVDFSEDTKSLLERLITAISNSSGQTVAATPAPAPVVNQAPAPIVNQAPAPVVNQAPAVSTDTLLTSIREMINTKATEQKTEGIVKLLGQFGAQNASSLLPENYQAFYDQLKAL